jgi:hypothetical protein
VITRGDFECAGDALPRPHDNCYWLLAGRLLAGEHPASDSEVPLEARLQAFQRSGFTHFIDLTGPAEAALVYVPLPVGAQAVARESFPIVDFGVPDVAGMRRTLDAIDAALAAGYTVYLHCHAGAGRTGTVAGCLLVEHGFSPEEALELLQRKWVAVAKRNSHPDTPETAAQRSFVAAWRAGDAG